MICFEAVAVCDVCGKEEKVRFRLQETDGPTLLMLQGVPTPKGWEYQHKAGKRGLSCTECVEKAVLRAL